MSYRSLAAVALSLGLLAACADTDGDGLNDGREKRLGTDPEALDSDGDGLRDKRELKVGTDPLAPDTDGDGYLDGDEMHAGVDPLDAGDVIYEGGWPYNRKKDDIEDPGLSSYATQGELVGRHVGVDQFGQEVDLYDFAGHGKPVIVDISAEWCPPCRDMARWLDGGTMQGMERYEPIREAIDSGDLYWVTILSEDAQGNPADLEAVQRWYEDFPQPNIAVVADDDRALMTYFRLQFYPSVYLLGDDMVYERGPSTQSWVPPLEAALDQLSE